MYRARDRATQEIVAVKHMTGVFRHNHHAKKILRELSILMQLSSEPENNLFFTQLIDVIVPYHKSGEDDKKICIQDCYTLVDSDDGKDQEEKPKMSVSNKNKRAVSRHSSRQLLGNKVF